MLLILQILSFIVRSFVYAVSHEPPDIENLLRLNPKVQPYANAVPSAVTKKVRKAILSHKVEGLRQCHSLRRHQKGEKSYFCLLTYKCSPNANAVPSDVTKKMKKAVFTS